MVGEVKAYAGNSTPAGWLLCDGSAVSRTTYARLFEVIGETYGSGDGESTFNLPNLIDKFIQGNATAGTVKSAGLPNITGRIDRSVASFAGAVQDVGTGAFSGSGQTDLSARTQSGGVGSYFTVNFDASRSSSIYGNSTTVQPPALTMRYIIKF